MKTSLLLLAACFSLTLQAQTLKEKGTYVDSDGELFNGTISQTENNIRAEITIRDGKKSGPAYYYFPSGKLMETGFFNQNTRDLKWTRYNETGTVSAVAFYHLGKRDGTWLVYDDAGRKRYEMSYKDGEKTGAWTSWDETGKVSETKDYSRVD